MFAFAIRTVVNDPPAGNWGKAPMAASSSVPRLIQVCAVGATALSFVLYGCNEPPAQAQGAAPAPQGAPLMRPTPAPDGPPPVADTPPLPSAAPSPQTNTEENVAPASPAEAGDYKIVAFDELAGFEYWPYSTPEGENSDSNTPENANIIPDKIKALDGQRVAVTGFMVPIEIRNGKIYSFMLVRNQMACCFGMPVSPNEWIDVEMANKNPAKYLPDIPLMARGVISVGEKKTEDGMVISIYRMVADDVAVKGGF